MNWQTTPTTKKKYSEKPPGDPFFLIFPWFKAFGILFLFVFGILFVYRVSSTGGRQVEESCFAAIIAASVPGLIGFYIISKSWGKDSYGILIAAMFALIIRLLTGGVGVAIITVFTDINQSWFVCFLIFYYLAFMAMDVFLAVWIIRNSEMTEQKEVVNGNLWDAFS